MTRFFRLLIIGCAAALLFAPTVSAADDVLNITMRKMYVVSAESEKESAYLDRLYAAFKIQLDSSPKFKFIPIETIQQLVQQIVLADWNRLGAEKLMLLQDRFHLDAFFFFNLVKTDSGFTAKISAYEFPSHVFIDAVELAIDPRQDNIDGLLHDLQPLLTSIYQKHTTNGFPIPPMQKGILLLSLTDDNTVLKTSLAVSAAVQIFNHEDDFTPTFVCPVVNKPLQKQEDAALLARRLLTDLSAEAVIVFSGEEKQTVFFPTSPVQKSALDNHLPLWPPLAGFSRFSVAADSSYIFELAKSLFPKNILEDDGTYLKTGSEMMRSLLLKKIQTLETEAPADSLRAATLDHLYPQLPALFTESEREYGWVEANYADRLLQRGDKEAALSHFKAARQNFNRHIGPLGLLLAGSRQASIEEEMQRFDDAESTLKEALTVAENLPDELAAAYFYYRLGNLSFAADRRLEAWERFGYSADSYFRAGDTLKVAQIYTKMGILMRQSNSLLKSKEYLEKSLKLAQVIGDEREAAYAHYQLGVTCKELYEDSAQAHFEEAADGLEMLGDIQNLANCEEHIGDLLAKKNQPLAAQHSYEAAVRYYRQAGAPDDVLRSLVKCADVAAQRQKWLAAQKSYDEALAQVSKEQNSPWGAVVLYKKGLAHISAGELELGEKELEQARENASIDLNQIDGFMEHLLRQLETELNSLTDAPKP
jgi:tetratricopeptide (TPR) repeat protein